MIRENGFKMLREQLDLYIRNTIEIRALSRPDPLKLDSDTAYSKVLRANFIRIGEIAKENRAILSSVLHPLLAGEDLPCDEDLDILNCFSEKLLNVSSIESLDIPLSHLISTRLF